MKISSNGLNMIKKWEGCRLKAYRDVSGILTIGYGHTGKICGSPITEGMTIDQMQADVLLADDVAWAEKAVNAMADRRGFNLNQNQFDALVSFTFNCGVGNLNTLCQTPRTLSDIGDKITLYNKSNGKVIQGLINRRNDEQKLFKTACVYEIVENNRKQAVVDMLVNAMNLIVDVIEEIKNGQ